MPVKPGRRCTHCGEARPVHDGTYIQLTGMLILFRISWFNGPFCRPCSESVFERTALHTLTLGWWSPLSAILTLPTVLFNGAVRLRASWLPSAAAAEAAQIADGLDSQREYALGLLATKDVATVVEVLVQQTGCPRDAVIAWLKRIVAES